MKKRGQSEVRIKLNLKKIKQKEVRLLTSGIRIIVEKNGRPAVCPYCGTPSTKIYERRKQIILDKPQRDKRVEIELNKRRFICVNPHCPLKTFTESVDGLASNKRYTQAFRKFISNLVQREGYFKAHKTLNEKYNLKISLSSLFYLNHNLSKKN